ncbi:MAG: hypothetical protein EBU08_20775, partial [Micrococcales bacterium]|nr:hypothetical protein [Micrococcales bacterium]
MDFHAVFEEADISRKGATTHIHRTDLICRQAEAGVSHIESKIHQGFEHTTSTDIYLRGSLNTLAMLPAVGWKGNESFFCWWESDETNIPGQLLHAIFPKLDDVYEFAKYVHQETGGDASAVAVCEVLKYLRRV